MEEKAKPKRASHVLDLSKHVKAKAPKRAAAAVVHHEHKHKPAQTIHGVRRQSEPRELAKAKKAEPKPEVAHASRHQAQAARIGKSQAISKFGPSLQHAKASHQEEPEAPPEPIPLTAHQTYRVNTKAAAADRAAAIALQHSRYTAPQPATAAPKPAKKHSRRRSPWRKLANVFRTHPRLATAATVVSIVLVLVGYVTYLNYPNIALRVAANRAGIDAQLPAYVPSGYSMNGPINYAPGQITIRFNSHSDAGFITVAQRKTDWDSSSLLENYVLTKSDQYLTFQQNGLTIYMYNGNNAAWVNRGIFYSIEGNNYLNSEQILKVVTSL